MDRGGGERAACDESDGQPSTRDQRRSTRKRAVRPRTQHRFGKYAIEIGRAAYPEQPGIDYERPATRGDCERLRGVDAEGRPNPCPFVSCRFHLYLDVNEANGGIKLNFPDLEPHELADTCALDVADRGEHKLEDVGDRMNITRERVRQIERRLFDAVRKHRPGAAEHVSPVIVPRVPLAKRRLPLVVETMPAGAKRTA